MHYSAIALAIFAAILFYSGASTLSLYDPIYAQVNILPGTDESTNTTSGGGGVGSSAPPTAVTTLNAAEIAATNSLNLDSDVKNLVILIPDKRLITQSFLPPSYMDSNHQMPQLYPLDIPSILGV